MLFYATPGRDRPLAFIHVPKNGGKSIRRALDGGYRRDLAPLADDLGMARDALAHALDHGDGIAHPALGTIKVEHLPLALWREHFPRCWERFGQAEPFLLLRDPRDRFLSAIMQRLGEFKDVRGLRADSPEVTAEARRVCDWLDGRGPFADREYIHFARQADYVGIGQEELVRRRIPLERAELATEWIAPATGTTASVTHDHARREPKGWARALVPAARAAGRTLLPLRLRQAIYPLWLKSGLFANASQRYREVPLDPGVEAFIASYYERDGALHAQALADTAQGGDA